MAWSDNIRCLHCDGKLPLYRKITSGQFCSAVHRKAYWQDQERLAVERLHQTHDSLRAYRPPDALEGVLGRSAASEPVSPKYYQTEHEIEVESQPEAAEIARSASNTGNVKFPGFLTEDKPALRAWDALQAAWDVEFAHWPMSDPLVPSTVGERAEFTLQSAPGMALPFFQAHALAAQIRAEADTTDAIDFSPRAILTIPLRIPLETEELSLSFLETLRAADVAAPVEETPRFAESLMALPKIGARETAIAFQATQTEPLQVVSRAQNARYDAAVAIPAVAAITRMQPLALTNKPLTRAARAGATGDAQAGDLQGYSQPMELTASTGAPWMNLAIPAADLAPDLASGSRYPVFGSAGVVITNLAATQAAQAIDFASETANPSKPLMTRSLELSVITAPGARYAIASQPGTMAPVSEVERSGAVVAMETGSSPQKQLATQILELSPHTAPRCDYPAVESHAGMIQPVSNAQTVSSGNELRIVPLPDGFGAAERIPATAQALPLAFRMAACAPDAARPNTTGVAQIYAANAPLHPAAKWEPADGAETPPLRPGFLAGWTQTFANSGDRKHVWAHAADFLQHAPRDLKLLAIAIPILLGLALRPSLPKVQVTAPAATEGISRNIGNGFRAQLVNVRNSVAQRAAVSLSEDFRSGLDDWQTRGDLASGWSFDGNGFVRPGTLALYRPSLGLGDYDMEFLGLVDKKALSWVVRAKDFDNYYVVKLVVTKAGPLPTIGITRYAVIDGKAQASVSTVAAINARPDMLYRVSMNVHDDTFLLSLQGTVVDNWTDSRLKRGGIGFFASRGEESRLRWLQITHQYDMLGRLCAYLAPYNISTTNGSW